MGQEFSWPAYMHATAEARFLSWVSPFENLVDKTFTGTGFSIVSVIPPLTVLHMLVLQEAQKGEAWEPSKKAMLRRKSGNIGLKSTSMSCFLDKII